MPPRFAVVFAVVSGRPGGGRDRPAGAGPRSLRKLVPVVACLAALGGVGATGAAAQSVDPRIEKNLAAIDGFVSRSPGGPVIAEIERGFPEEFAVYRKRLADVAAVGGDMRPGVVEAVNRLEQTVMDRYRPIANRAPAALRDQQMDHMLRSAETVKSLAPDSCVALATDDAPPESGLQKYDGTDHPIGQLRRDGNVLRFRILAGARDHRGDPVAPMSADDGKALQTAVTQAMLGLGYSAPAVQTVLQRRRTPEVSGAGYCDLFIAFFAAVKGTPADLRLRFLSTLPP